MIAPSSPLDVEMDNWRVAVLGSSGVGKTALLKQEFDPTIEDIYLTQLVVDNRTCFVETIDTAGAAEYATFIDQWVRAAQGIILVYSVTSRSSFEYLEAIHQSMRKVKQGNPIFTLVGNKCDLTYAREVSKADGAALARQYGCEFFETSAKTTQNIERLFINLVRSLRQTSGNDTKSNQEPYQSANKERKLCNCVIM